MSYGQTYANDLFAIDAAASDRAKFLQRTYLHLFGAILAFIGLEAVLLSVVPPADILRLVMGNGSIGMLVIFAGYMGATWLAQSWASRSASPSTQYMGLALYTVVEVLFFAPILSLATLMDKGGGNIIPTAGLITLLMFGGLTTIVLVSGANFSFLRTALMIGGW